MPISIAGSSDHDIDDDDIVAIQEQKTYSYHEHHFPTLDEVSRCWSPSQQRPTTSGQSQAQQRHRHLQPQLPQQRHCRRRRRRQQPASAAATAAANNNNTYSSSGPAQLVLPTNQQARIDAHAPSSARDVLDESSAFASLQSLLEQQPLSLSLTQDDENNNKENDEQLNIPSEEKIHRDDDLQRQKQQQDDEDCVHHHRYHQSQEQEQSHQQHYPQRHAQQQQQQQYDDLGNNHEDRREHGIYNDGKENIRNEPTRCTITTNHNDVMVDNNINGTIVAGMDATFCHHERVLPGPQKEDDGPITTASSTNQFDNTHHNGLTSTLQQQRDYDYDSDGQGCYGNYDDNHQDWTTLPTASVHGLQDHHDPQVSTLDREVQRQRERRRSATSASHHRHHRGRSSTSSKTGNNSSSSPMMMILDDDEPTDSLRQRLEKERHHQKKKKKTTRSVSADKILLEDNNYYDYDNHHPRPLKQQRRHRHGNQSRSVSPKRSISMRSSSPKHHQQQQPVPVEKVKKSIVGYRPSHWGRDNRKPFRGATSATATSNSSGRQRRQLAAACTSSILMPPPPARTNNSRRGSHYASSPTPHHQRVDPMNISTISIPTSSTNTTTTTTTSNMNTSGVSTSFKPDFLPTRTQGSGIGGGGAVNSHNNTRDPTEIDAFDDTQSVGAADTDGDNNNNTSSTTTTTNVSFLATVRAAATNLPRGRRKSATSNTEKDEKRNQKSVLSMLLKEVKSDMRINETRLRSGEYPFPSKVTSRFDLYDPRNQATSYMDVTLLGETCIPWKSTAQISSRGRQPQAAHQNTTILGYIHAHHIYPERDVLLATDLQCVIAASAQNGSSSSSRSGGMGGGGGALAWVCLSGDTIQEHNLQKNGPRGYQLRIYNAIVIPTAVDTTGGEESSEGINCQYTVLCTRLCETYPAHILGPLQPELAEMLAHFGDVR